MARVIPLGAARRGRCSRDYPRLQILHEDVGEAVRVLRHQVRGYASKGNIAPICGDRGWKAHEFACVPSTAVDTRVIAPV